jgi:hypothetical protein
MYPTAPHPTNPPSQYITIPPPIDFTTSLHRLTALRLTNPQPRQPTNSSPHHPTTTSPHHHITTSPHHHITTSPHHSTTPPPHHPTTSPPHHLTTQTPHQPIYPLTHHHTTLPSCHLRPHFNTRLGNKGQSTCTPPSLTSGATSRPRPEATGDLPCRHGRCPLEQFGSMQI